MRSMRTTLAALLLLGLAVSPAMAQPAAEAQARKVLARFSGEPTVNEVQKAALDYAQMHPGMFQAMRTRARYAALLPEVKIRLTRDDDEQSRSLTRFSESSDPQDISATRTVDDGLELQGEVKWKLGDLVFNARETGVVKENRYTAKERQRLLQTVTQVFFERRRAQLSLVLSPPGEVSARALAELKIAQLTGELDALTGGAFSRMVANR